MAPPRLFDLTINIVLDYIDKYDKDLVKTIIEPIQPIMIKKMVEMVMNHHLKCDGQDDHQDKLWAILTFLINSKFYTKLNTLDMPRMNCPPSTLSNSRFQKFIRCLGANTPNLRELRIYKPTVNGEYSLDERELDSIFQLKNLTILTIFQVHVSLSGILEISRRCEKLDLIRACRVLMDVELSCAAFGDDFAYVYIDAFNFYLWQVSLKMERTMSTKDPKYKDNTNYVRLSLMPRNIQELFHLVQSLAEKLKDIWIDSSKLNDVEEIVEFPRLPHIKFAEIDCGDKSAHALRRFMRRNGENLQELTLFHVDIKEKMTFAEIFTFCPNLQSLELFSCTLVGNNAPLYEMQQLKRFKWSNLCLDAYDEGAFSSILSAPLLEELYINLPKINFSDNATVIARIQSREILRNLKKIDMNRWMIRIPSDDDYASYLARFTELKNALELAIITAGIAVQNVS